MAKLQTFSQYFKLNKSQYELDFIDVPVNNGDIPLYIDPYSISKRSDYWSIDCHNAIVDFFQDVIDQIVKNKEAEAKYMLSGLREPNQTRFGLSTGKKPRGRGVGGEQTVNLYNALADSTAVKTGFIKDLEECELLIEGIGRDKISDISTNIIRHKLIEYTHAQCELWNIPIAQAPSGFVWNAVSKRWSNEYIDLPICNGRSVILVPKAIARFNIEFNHQEYYQHFVLNFLQAEHLGARSSLVRTLKDGTKKPPTKKALKELHPLSKSYLYEFSKEHPEVLKRYKESKNYNPKEISVDDLSLLLVQETQSKQFNFNDLSNKLNSIPAGDTTAQQFHDCILGLLTAIFYPNLINPKKEQKIHDGRKRIDISFQNASRDGFFFNLPNVKKVPSGYIFVECKNYTSDPKNLELDQLSGRFSINRGQFGFLVCRTLKDRPLFIKRCKDTAQDGRGFIIALDDSDINTMLDLRSKNDILGLNSYLDDRYKELVI